MSTTIILALLSVSLGSVGQFLLKVGVNSIGGFSLGRNWVTSIVRTIFEIHIFCGIILFVSSMMLWLVVISKTELSKMYPIVSISYALVALLSHFFLKESLPPLRIAGIAVILVGVVLVNL